MIASATGRRADRCAPRHRAASALAGMLAAAVALCARPAAGGELVVFEAASLRDAFARLIPRFERDNASTKVVTNAAGSQELRAQIEHGAAADVFASADRKHMDALAAQGLVVGPTVFTCNQAVVVVRRALAATVKTLADLPRVDRIVLGAPEVPIGHYTVEILKKAAATLGAEFPGRVDAKVVSRELNVRQVLAKVRLGEADAGVVYRSDAVAAADQVSVIAIPPELNVAAQYPIAQVKSAPHGDLARRWIELVKSPTGAAALREAGFMPCPAP
ncbi:MAG TPA: molybdate ABC transporter substrate-binding protein [Polyangia bacterium]|jgi:molybdate transport system substrate-binding protein|nr:molybdate ABC transporter substrate-binding protein [Polyangia bacterium]